MQSCFHFLSPRLIYRCGWHLVENTNYCTVKDKVSYDVQSGGQTRRKAGKNVIMLTITGLVNFAEKAVWVPEK